MYSFKKENLPESASSNYSRDPLEEPCVKDTSLPINSQADPRFKRLVPRHEGSYGLAPGKDT